MSVLKGRGDLRMKKSFIVLAVMAIALAGAALAVPGNVTDSEGTTTIIGSRGIETTGTVNAEAGNVTQLTVADTTETQFWQGLFGTATVSIELSDGTNTFYSWPNNNPTGQLFFARSAINNWGNVVDSVSGNVLTEQNTNGMADNAFSIENLTSTYVDITHASFSVGGNAINSPTPGVNIDDFKALFLWDTGNTQGVYTAIINQSGTGYDGGTYDFEILLPTNGAAVASYYVYAQLS
ncbi:hypothetical protein D6764_03910 [Candidatus Woesearchaeota archaeon]|nr:MAG: hypothetical protein D6764_03910 [Candidatus Woesearchaeota archaeon]